ncbi:ATP-binding protein [Flaviflagellibacter deserti]|uniref:ATP-binding protein n=1 Tax=Flaviflagellibacter deserti TaxID=2267266 RepID=A0ABV9Z2G7_9HYPH
MRLDLNLKKAQLALAVLSLAPNARIGREELNALLWSDRSEEQARQSGRQTLASIRKAFAQCPMAVLDGDLTSVGLNEAAVEIDVARFRALVEQSDPTFLREAVELYSGPLLDGLMISDPEGQAWLLQKRQELESAALRAIEKLLDLSIDEARFDDVERLARRALELDPVLEEAHRALIAVYLSRGQRALAARQFKKCRDLLSSELGVAPSERTASMLRPAIVSAASKEKPVQQPEPAATVRKNNLPDQLAALIGRDDERSEVARRLERSRVVTLTGSGGAGKTRLSIQVGFDLLDRFNDEVWLIELAAIENPQLVAESICGTLGVPAQGGRSAIDTAVDFLAHRRALLILDNCEHVIAAAAAIAEAIARSCPDVRILATSREPLAISGEETFRIPNLGFPPSSRISASEARRHSAVQLLMERASRLVERFELTDANAPAIARICQQVDGIPLAIELAAPRLRAMAPEQLADQLHNMFSILTSGSRTVMPRHQTLKNLFDWSYGLLNSQEQALLRRLSIFADGWRLEAAEWVATAEPLEPGSVVDLLASLIDKSLVVVDLSSREPRYKLLEATRQYSWAKLVEARETGLRRHFAEYLISYFSSAEASWPTMSTSVWRERYEPELDNLRATLEWAFSEEGDATLGVELAAYGIRLWNELSLLSERGRWVETAFARLDEGHYPDTAARLWLGRTSVSAHGDQSSIQAAEKAAELYHLVGDSLGEGEALAKAGAARMRPSDTASASDRLREAGELLEPIGPTKQLCDWLRSLAVGAYFDGDFDRARILIRQSLGLAQDIGDTHGTVNAQIALAELELVAGNPEQAVIVGRGVLEGNRANRRQIVLGLGNLTSYLLVTGRDDEAITVASDALREAQGLGWPAAVVRMVEHCALISCRLGDVETAARLIGFGDAFYAKGTASREHTEQVSYDAAAACMATMTPGQAAALKAEGSVWTEGQAVREAGRILRSQDGARC